MHEPSFSKKGNQYETPNGALFQTNRMVHQMTNEDEAYAYEIDETLMRVLVRVKVIEARECLHCALVMQKHGFPQQAAYEHMLKRKRLKEARIAQSVYK